MEVGIYHFTHGPKSRVPSMTWMPTWQHSWGQAFGLVLRVGSSKKLDPTLNTSPMNICAQNNQDRITMLINHT